ncbi:hypothetical protein Droror1_Dr00027429 [Drosera rotundifolia]
MVSSARNGLPSWITAAPFDLDKNDVVDSMGSVDGLGSGSGSVDGTREPFPVMSLVKVTFPNESTKARLGARKREHGFAGLGAAGLDEAAVQEKFRQIHQGLAGFSIFTAAKHQNLVAADRDTSLSDLRLAHLSFWQKMPSHLSP